MIEKRVERNVFMSIWLFLHQAFSLAARVPVVASQGASPMRANTRIAQSSQIFFGGPACELRNRQPANKLLNNNDDDGIGDNNVA